MLTITNYSVQFSSFQSLSRVRLFTTPWIAARQTSLSITNSRRLPKPMSTESVMYRHIIIKLSNYLYILVFTRMNLSFQQCESLLHSFFAENTLTEIAYLVVPAGWFFPAAATWFFFSFFSKMGVCLTFFVGSGVSWRLTYNGVRLNLYSNYWLPLQQGLPDFQL